MKFFLIGIMGLLAGLIVARAFLPSTPSDNTEQAAIAEVRNTTPRNAEELEALIDEMVEARDELTKLLETERVRFAELSSEVEDLVAQFEQLENTTLGSDIGQLAQDRERRTATRTLDDLAYNKDTLVDAGLTEVEADRILELEAQARSEIQELLADPENRDRSTIREAVQEISGQIRTELGDYGYETYLTATGRSTSVPVGNVDPDSAGAIAGIQAGDQIISYAGERVFDINDLQTATTSGIEGETVVVELIRDDQTVSLVMPRGQIGISTRNRRDR